mgnify:FL=1
MRDTCPYIARCLNTRQCYRCEHYHLLRLAEDRIRLKRRAKRSGVAGQPAWRQFEHEVARRLSSVPTVVEYESRRQPASGALPGSPGDVWDEVVLNESKLRNQHTAAGRTQHTVKREWLEKVAKEAGPGKVPLYTFRFADSLTYAILRFDDLLELIHEVKLLRAERANLQLALQRQAAQKGGE